MRVLASRLAIMDRAGADNDDETIVLRTDYPQRAVRSGWVAGSALAYLSVEHALNRPATLNDGLEMVCFTRQLLDEANWR